MLIPHRYKKYINFSYLKAPRRRLLFKKKFPSVPLPPEPIITRWGTWLEAVTYYTQNFEKIEDIMNDFDTEDSEAISRSKEAIDSSTFKTNLIFINTNFACIPQAITKLQERGLNLIDSLQILQAIQDKLKSQHLSKYSNKLKNILKRNPDFEIVNAISNVLKTGKNNMPSDLKTYTALELEAFKYAPITSCDVERYFSMYKEVLRDNRRRFLFENLEQHVILFCNKLEE